MFSQIGPFLEQMRADIAAWETPVFPWFRGQPVDKPLLPKVFRDKYPERDLIDEFRLRAPALGETPGFSDEGEWLFLMQHHGLPTRLLDWTEGALIALYFAVSSANAPKSPVVWMINPIELNRHSIGKPQHIMAQREEGRVYIRSVFGDPPVEFVSPAAISPNNIHRRMAAQRSRFTVFGNSRKPLEKQLQGTDMVKKGFLRKYAFIREEAKNIESELMVYGISHSTVFPDLDGLAYELTHFNSNPSTR